MPNKAFAHREAYWTFSKIRQQIPNKAFARREAYWTFSNRGNKCQFQAFARREAIKNLFNQNIIYYDRRDKWKQRIKVKIKGKLQDKYNSSVFKR